MELIVLRDIVKTEKEFTLYGEEKNTDKMKKVNNSKNK